MFRLISHYMYLCSFFLHFFILFSRSTFFFTFPLLVHSIHIVHLVTLHFFSASSQLYLFQLLHTNFSKNILSPLTLLSHFILSLIYGFTFLFRFIPLLSPYTSEYTFSHFLSTCFTQFLIHFLYLFSHFPFLSTLVLWLLVRCLFLTQLSFSNLTLFFLFFSFLLVIFSLYFIFYFFFFFVHSTCLLSPLLP